MKKISIILLLFKLLYSQDVLPDSTLLIHFPSAQQMGCITSEKENKLIESFNDSTLKIHYDYTYPNIANNVRMENPTPYLVFNECVIDCVTSIIGGLPYNQEKFNIRYKHQPCAYMFLKEFPDDLECCIIKISLFPFNQKPWE